MKLKDRYGKKCKCGGTYKETTFFDDMDGVLHCNKCGKQVKRYLTKRNK